MHEVDDWQKWKTTTASERHQPELFERHCSKAAPRKAVEQVKIFVGSNQCAKATCMESCYNMCTTIFSTFQLRTCGTIQSEITKIDAAYDSLNEAWTEGEVCGWETEKFLALASMGQHGYTQKYGEKLAWITIYYIYLFPSLGSTTLLKRGSAMGPSSEALSDFNDQIATRDKLKLFGFSVIRLSRAAAAELKIRTATNIYIYIYIWVKFVGS